jgi:hypothetical protein
MENKIPKDHMLNEALLVLSSKIFKDISISAFLIFQENNIKNQSSPYPELYKLIHDLQFLFVQSLPMNVFHLIRK